MLISAIVIDDDRDTANTMAEYLEILGVNVWGIGYDGKRAVELYDIHRPGIVFLDLIMPEYDGLYALENIRKLDYNAKVIVVTADLRKEMEERLDLLKPTEIIYKPFNPEVLKVLIEKHGSASHRSGSDRNLS